MNIYLIWTACGRKFYVRASYSFDAVNAVERLGLKVSSWDIPLCVPQDMVMNAWEVGL